MEELTEKQREHADAIYWSSECLADLIGNTLKLNKLENQAIAPVAETYDLCGQLAQCAVAYEPAWERRGLDFEASMEEVRTLEASKSSVLAAVSLACVLAWQRLHGGVGLRGHRHATGRLADGVPGRSGVCPVGGRVFLPQTDGNHDDCGVRMVEGWALSDSALC